MASIAGARIGPRCERLHARGETAGLVTSIRGQLPPCEVSSDVRGADVIGDAFAHTWHSTIMNRCTADCRMVTYLSKDQETLFGSSFSRKSEVDRIQRIPAVAVRLVPRGVPLQVSARIGSGGIRGRTGTYRLNVSKGAATLATAAQRDNEHEKRIKVVGSSDDKGILHKGDNLRSRIVENDGETTISVETDWSYYLSSFTLDLTRQMYEDFGDTAFVITDIAEFFRRLHSAAIEKGLYVTSAPVRYSKSSR